MIIIPQILKKVNEFSEYFVACFFKHLNLMFSEKKTIDEKQFSRYNNKS